VSHVFLASSPRHVLLAAGAVCSGEVRGDAHLYVVEHLPRASVERWMDVLLDWESSPFRSVTRLDGDWRPEVGDRSGLARHLAKRGTKARFRRENGVQLEAELGRLRPEKVWVGCDTYYEAQLSLAVAKGLRPEARGAYLEDGTAAYERTFRESGVSRALQLKRARDLARRFLYGSWWRGPEVPGTSPWIDEAWLAFPELAVEELRAKELRRLSPEPFRGPELGELARSSSRAFGADPGALADASLVVALTRSTVARFVPGYVEGMTAVVEELLARGSRVALKFHPRERDPGFLPVADRAGVDVVPSALPFELLLGLSRSPELAVVGDVSTALLSTRWLLPDARVVALRCAPEGTAPGRYLDAVLERLEIPVLRDPSAVADLCAVAAATA
jgi:hypothetical protein